MPKNAKCKTLLHPFCILHFAFCILHFVPLALAEPSGVQRASHATEISGSPAKNRRAPAEVSEPRRISRDESLPLPPRGASREDAGDNAVARAFQPASGLATGMASLAVVLGLFLAAAWAVRRGMPAAPTKLPSEVVEVLGRTPLAGRQFAHLVRCGNKLLLVHLAPGCAETLTEVTDPVEVDRLAGLCRQAHPQSATTSFRQVFQQWGKKDG
jgi:flagellar biogenesis protein FliO